MTEHRIPTTWAERAAAIRCELDALDRIADPDERAHCLATLKQEVHLATLIEPLSLEVAPHFPGEHSVQAQAMDATAPVS